MDRRKFLIGMGAASIGGSALLGTGAFTRVEAQRRVKIQIAEDPDAYLGLDRCHLNEETTPNSSYIDFQDGHLAIEMSPENPTADGGYGINSDSRTWFHNVFQICNQGKQAVCVWIEEHEAWPRVIDEDFEDEDYSAYDGDRRVHFYVGDDPETSFIGQENRIVLGVGDCICIGLMTNTKGLKEGDQLLDELENEIVIHADADCVEDPNGPPIEHPAISFVSFCVDEGSISADDITIEPTQFKNGDPVQIEWTSTVAVSSVTLKGGPEYWHFDDGGTSGTATMGEGDGPDSQTGQSPSSPCPDGSCGVKFEWDDDAETFVAEDDHQDIC